MENYTYGCIDVYLSVSVSQSVSQSVCLSVCQSTTRCLSIDLSVCLSDWLTVTDRLFQAFTADVKQTRDRWHLTLALRTRLQNRNRSDERKTKSHRLWSLDEKLTESQTDGRTYGRTDRQTEWRTDGRTDRHTDRQTDRQTNRQIGTPIWQAHRTAPTVLNWNSQETKSLVFK